MDVFEFDAGAAADEGGGFGMVAHCAAPAMWRALPKGGDTLGDVDQRDRKIARGVQHRKRQRADQDRLGEMQRVPVHGDLAAADPKEAAEIDDGGANLAVAVHEHVHDPAHVLVA